VVQGEEAEDLKQVAKKHKQTYQKGGGGGITKVIVFYIDNFFQFFM
jgi:hypothetical protein